MVCEQFKVNPKQLVRTILTLLKKNRVITSIDVARSLGVPIECMPLYELTIDTVLRSYNIRTTKVKYCKKCKKIYSDTKLKYCPVHKDTPLIPINKYEKI